ncbi:mechanosensitive ion channel domain-containing protein [Lyngbya aestuarii]|uniref:mechanosensitive ion channel domain-containing protein n=1 Tax=Lyngbya aestuarii TaxID=118322 RepID=UPI00403E1FD5
MPSAKQASFTLFTLAFLAIRRFWRQVCCVVALQSAIFKRSQRLLPRRLPIVLLGVLTLLLTILPMPSSAQIALTTRTDKAPVVVDGKVLFEVRSLGDNYTAAERAELINEALVEELNSSEEVEIEVIQEDQQTIIRSRGNQTNSRHLLTVTKEDVISGASPFSQALIWQDKLEHALFQGKQERTPAYFNQALIYAVVVLLVMLFLQVGLLFLGKLASHLLLRWLPPSPFPQSRRQHPAQLFLRVALLGLQLGLWGAVAFYLTDIFPHARTWRYKVFHAITSPAISLGESKQRLSIVELLLLLALTVGLWFAVSAFTRFFQAKVLSQTAANPGMQQVISTLSQYLLTFLGLLVLLQSWGLDVGSLAIFASVLGVGIAFGVQNIANNFISGLIITLERPIQIGDFVKVGDFLGVVQSIGARSTVIQTLDQVAIIVPNSRFLESEVINWSHGDPVSRLRIPVGVAYGSNVGKVKKALLEAAKSHPEVLNRPKPQVWFQEFAESSLNFDLLVWTGVPKKQFLVKSDLNYRIEASLRRYDIEVPFPQRDLHLRSPQLEEFVTSWLKKNAETPSEKQLGSVNGSKPTVDLDDDTAIGSVEALPETTLATTNSVDSTTEIDIEELVKAMRGSDGLDIKERYYRLNLYPACFAGSEAVIWLMQAQDCTTEEAIELGQMLIDQEIIHHVTDEHPFKDEYLFYRFYCDES